MIEIVDWDKHYENNRTRELKRMAWVPMPNRHDGDGYTQLLDHLNGAAHFGAWCALVEVASRCDVRGTLLRDGAVPHDESSLARMTRIPAKIWEEALPRLLNIGWIKGYGIPHEGAVIPHPAAIERNGKNGTERKEPVSTPVAPAHPDASVPQTATLIYKLHEKAREKLEEEASVRLGKPKKKIFYDYDERVWRGITQADLDFWADDFDGMEILSELKKMKAWLDSHPKKKDFKKFIANWLLRGQGKSTTFAGRGARR